MLISCLHSSTVGRACLITLLFGLAGSGCTKIDRPDDPPEPSASPIIPCNCPPSPPPLPLPPPPPPTPPSTCAELADSHEPVPNTHMYAAIVLVGPRDSCFLPNYVPTLISPGEELPVHIRLVFRDQILVPVSNMRLEIEVLNSFAVPDPKAFLNTNVIRTGSDGFPISPIIFISNDIGVFKVLVRFRDGPLIGTALSENIIVFPS